MCKVKCEICGKLFNVEDCVSDDVICKDCFCESERESNYYNDEEA